MSHRKWTAEDMAYIAEHIDLPRRELAAHFGITYKNMTARITMARRQMGLPVRKTPIYDRYDDEHTKHHVRYVLGDVAADKVIRFLAYLCKFSDIAKAKGEQININKFIDAYAEVWDRD